MRNLILIILIVLLSSISFSLSLEKNKKGGNLMIKVSSSSFTHNGMIPTKFTCEGENISPHIKWENIPENTKSIALLCDDPDAPVGDWVHWLLFNIPVNINEFSENVSNNFLKEKNIKIGKNDFGKLNYGGPCPPSGTHRYFFKVYALDIVLDAKDGLTKKEFLKLIDGHILAQGELIGKYKKIK